MSITGPYDSTEAGDSPSRKKIFTATPTSAADEEACAKKILSPIMRRAYRRPITDEDLARPLKFFREARTGGGFDAGIEAALSAILVSREFLFRVEQEPNATPPGGVYQVSDIELASRLSYFLWSSIPDDELLADSASELDQRALDKVRTFISTLAENEAVCALQYRTQENFIL